MKIEIPDELHRAVERVRAGECALREAHAIADRNRVNGNVRSEDAERIRRVNVERGHAWSDVMRLFMQWAADPRR